MTLHLTNADGSDVTDASGITVDDQTTGTDGSYTFTNLLPGEYTVTIVTAPTGFVPTKAGIDPTTGSSTDTVTSTSTCLGVPSGWSRADSMIS